MNIFVLDTEPTICAQYHCDKHVVKMILETAQILSTVCRLKHPESLYELYGITHEKHPCVRWAARSPENFEWLYQLGCGLLNEYTYRYNKEHKSTSIMHLAATLKDLHGSNWKWTKKGLTVRPQCMPMDCKEFEAVHAYRKYYLTHKQNLLSYTRRPIPDWIACQGLGVQK